MSQDDVTSRRPRLLWKSLWCQAVAGESTIFLRDIISFLVEMASHYLPLFFWGGRGLKRGRGRGNSVLNCNYIFMPHYGIIKELIEFTDIKIIWCQRLFWMFNRHGINYCRFSLNMFQSRRPDDACLSIRSACLHLNSYQPSKEYLKCSWWDKVLPDLADSFILFLTSTLTFLFDTRRISPLFITAAVHPHVVNVTLVP